MIPSASAATLVFRARRRSLSAVGAMLILLLGLVMTWGTSNAAAFASPGAVNQCNGTDNAGGKSVACTVTITNHLNQANGKTRSTVVVKECHGAAHAPPTCTTTKKTVTHLTTSATQCNGSGNGGGATVTCSVSIVNKIVGKATATPATVNQCNTAGKGGGTQPTKICSPIGSTTSATVTQCNHSGNGGGGTKRVRCTVTTSTKTAALPVTVNQCVGSGNGGGATVTCTARVTNLITAAPSPSPTPSASPTPKKSHHPSGGGAPKSPGSTPPSAAPPGSTPPPNGKLPFTGFDTVPLLLGAFTALMIGVTLLVAARRPRLAGRHSLPRRGEK